MILEVTEPLTFGSLKQVSQGSFPANQSPNWTLQFIIHLATRHLSSFFPIKLTKLPPTLQFNRPSKVEEFWSAFCSWPSTMEFLLCQLSRRSWKCPTIEGPIFWWSFGWPPLSFIRDWYRIPHIFHILASHRRRARFHIPEVWLTSPYISSKVLRNRQCNLPRVCLWAAGWLDWLTHKGFGSCFFDLKLEVNELCYPPSNNQMASWHDGISRKPQDPR